MSIQPSCTKSMQCSSHHETSNQTGIHESYQRPIGKVSRQWKSGVSKGEREMGKATCHSNTSKWKVIMVWEGENGLAHIESSHSHRRQSSNVQKDVIALTDMPDDSAALIIQNNPGSSPAPASTMRQVLHFENKRRNKGENKRKTCPHACLLALLYRIWNFIQGYEQTRKIPPLPQMAEKQHRKEVKA